MIEEDKKRYMSLALGESKDVSVFVTLELCCFEERTSLYALALVSKHAKELFITIIDPRPKNQDEGIRLMRNSGVKV